MPLTETKLTNNITKMQFKKIQLVFVSTMLVAFLLLINLHYSVDAQNICIGNGGCKSISKSN